MPGYEAQTVRNATVIVTDTKMEANGSQAADAVKKTAATSTLHGYNRYLKTPFILYSEQRTTMQSAS